VAFDLHKWLHVPYDAACVLVRSPAAHRGAFAYNADYLDSSERGLAAGGMAFRDFGPQLSRGFRALKWVALQAEGLAVYRRLIEQNVQQAAYLAARVAEHPELELCAPVPLNIVCLRYVPAAGPDDVRPSEAELDALNRELLGRVHESGLALPSHTRISGRYVLRVAIPNHRSRREDFDLFVDAVAQLGRQLRGASRRP
jgi:glutamate/tyrosine decarboxylase-like PLP-dependent enzyme